MPCSPVPDLGALRRALGCAAAALIQAWRGDQDSVSRSLLEARAAAEEAYGCGSPCVDALNGLFTAITQTAAIPPEHYLNKRLAAVRSHLGQSSDLSRLGQERTMTKTTAADPPTARSLHEVCTDARRVNCGECWALPGNECVFTSVPVSVPVIPGTPVRPARGYHVARLGRAARRGLISGADLVAVLGTLPAFTTATVVYDVATEM